MFAVLAGFPFEVALLPPALQASCSPPALADVGCEQRRLPPQLPHARFSASFLGSGSSVLLCPDTCCVALLAPSKPSCRAGPGGFGVSPRAAEPSAPAAELPHQTQPGHAQFPRLFLLLVS